MAVRRSVILAVAAGAFSVLAPSSFAHASCAGPPSPSPYAFTGTVIETEARGRVATVMTDDGQTFTVFGTPNRSHLSTTYSSVDRRFALGGRYEFHPVNSGPPYQDNACTATRQLAGPRPQAAEPSDSTGFLPEWLPVDEQEGPTGYLLFFGPLAAAVLLFLAVTRRLRRWRRMTPGHGSKGRLIGIAADTPSK